MQLKNYIFLFKICWMLHSDGCSLLDLIGSQCIGEIICPFFPVFLVPPIGPIPSQDSQIKRSEPK